MTTAAPLGYRHRESCRLCEATDLEKVLSLAPSPPANAFVGASQLDEEQPCLPLDVWFCRRCAHVQLLDVVDPVHLFSEYVYTSGTSSSFVAHFEAYSREVRDRFGVRPGDLVVEIGSNDGTLLRFFQEAGQRVLGVDPARNLAAEATKSGIETLPAFFTRAFAEDIRNRYGSAKVVAANNVFAHIDDLSGVLDGVRRVLAEDGVFVFEVSYLVDVVEKTLFDTIYHEHLDYHSVQPLVPFFARHEMELVDVQRVPTHGGSLRGVAQHAGGPHPRSPSVDDLGELERAMALDRADTFVEFGARIDALGRELVSLLHGLRAEGKRIAGFGAPAKATTLMHHFGIGADLVDFIVDDSPLKQGLYTPGLHLPVLPPSEIYERRPDYLLVLAWNFATPIIRAHQRFQESGGHFIVPAPSVEIV